MLLAESIKNSIRAKSGGLCESKSDGVRERVPTFGTITPSSNQTKEETNVYHSQAETISDNFFIILLTIVYCVGI